ncbi:MAG: pre-16S rRNA-processing nuclease YqgF [Nostocaceae cyanobacterium]|nr:pre-16S rRNA-processing nuclease YqgF [Nostocaceae cyanobacterium]
MTNDNPVILGFDPGRDKCGVAVMAANQKLHYHEVVPASEAIATIKQLQQQFSISLLVMGNQTTAKNWKHKLQQELVESVDIVLVDERYTTLEARDHYWEMYPPKGLTKLLPKGMRNPPRPIDDIVAILLIERYLSANS